MSKTTISIPGLVSFELKANNVYDDGTRGKGERWNTKPVNISMIIVVSSRPIMFRYRVFRGCE